MTRTEKTRYIMNRTELAIGKEAYRPKLILNSAKAERLAMDRVLVRKKFQEVNSSRRMR